MSLSVVIAGVTVSIKHGSFKFTDNTNYLSTCSFDVLDATGLSHFRNGMPVTVTDSIKGLVFSGFVDLGDEDNLIPNDMIATTVTCKDNHYLANKRRVVEDYKNMLAGDIAVDLLSNYLTAEGVTANYAYQLTETQADWSRGNLSNVSATLNIGEGDLELAPAGSTVTHTDTQSADFQQGTLTSVDAGQPGQPGSQLNLHASNAIKFVATCQGGLGNAYLYWQIWVGAQAVTLGDLLQYDLWVSSTSPQIMCGVDILFSDGTTMRDFSPTIVDQLDFPAHPKTDLSAVAKDQWYTRTLSLNPANGKTVATMSIVMEGDNAGTYTCYFKNIKQVNGTTLRQMYWDGTTPSPYFQNSLGLQSSVLTSDNGYTAISLTLATVYDQVGTRISPAISIDAAWIARSSLVSWATVIPTNITPATQSGNAPLVPQGTTLQVYTSLDTKATWQLCTYKAPIPCLMPGVSIAGRSLYTKVVLSITGPSPEVTPILDSLTTSVTSSFNTIKSNTVMTIASQAGWNSGTLSNLQWDTTLTTPYLDIAGYTQNWQNRTGVIPNQPLFGSSSPAEVVNALQLQLSTGTGTDVRSRFDSPVTKFFGNFTMQVACTFQAAGNVGMGVVYATTGWQNPNDTYGYTVMLVQNFNNTGASKLQFGYGTNTSTGAGNYTGIINQTLPFTIQVGNTYTLTVIVQNNHHTVLIDGVTYLNSFFDGTYTASGQVGLRLYNNTGNMQVHNALNAGTQFHTIDLDFVYVSIPDGTPITVDAGGLHPETIYAYGTQSASTSTTSTIQITTNPQGSKATQAYWTTAFAHSAGVAATIPSPVSGSFSNFGILNNPGQGLGSVSGTWTSPGSNLANIATVGNSIIFWDNDPLPAGASILVQTSLDNGATYQIATNGQVIPNLGPGIAGAGKTLKIRFTLTTPNASTNVVLHGFTAWVTDGPTVSGTRISPALSLAPVGRAGSTSINWTATVPAHTTLGVDVSPDGNSWTDVTGSNGGPLPSTYIFSQPQPWLDFFGSDTSGFYLQTTLSGGGTATWTWNAPQGGGG